MRLQVAINARLILPHRMEGVARYILETTRCMVKDHPEADFHFYFDRKVEIDGLEGENVHFHVLKPPARHPFLWYLWFEWVLAKAMKKDKIDVFYSGESYLSLRSKVPVVMVSHDINYYHYPAHIMWSHLVYFRHYFPLFHKAADHIIAVSEFTKRDIIKAYNLNEDNITVAHNSAPKGFEVIDEDQKRRIKEKHTEGKDYFIYVGSLHPRKNVATLINAFNVFKADARSSHKLVIFGRVAFQAKAIFKAYNASDFKSDIIFLSNDEESVHKMMAAAQALCYVSLFEGFGIPILEAFHCGVPVITSNISSMPEVGGDAAILVSPHEIESIAGAMTKIAGDPELRSLLIRKGLARKDLFSWQKSSEIIWDNLLKVKKERLPS